MYQNSNGVKIATHPLGHSGSSLQPPILSGAEAVVRRAKGNPQAILEEPPDVLREPAVYEQMRAVLGFRQTQGA